LSNLGDERGDAWAADHHQVVAVEVDRAAQWDVLNLRLELEVASKVSKGVEGGEVFLGDSRPPVLCLALERNRDGQGVGAEERPLGWRSGLSKLGDAGSADSDDVGDVGERVAVLS
jgi:hypothetical protein